MGEERQNQRIRLDSQEETDPSETLQRLSDFFSPFLDTPAVHQRYSPQVDGQFTANLQSWLHDGPSVPVGQVEDVQPEVAEEPSQSTFTLGSKRLTPTETFDDGTKPLGDVVVRIDADGAEHWDGTRISSDDDPNFLEAGPGASSWDVDFPMEQLPIAVGDVEELEERLNEVPSASELAVNHEPSEDVEGKNRKTDLLSTEESHQQEGNDVSGDVNAGGGEAATAAVVVSASEVDATDPKDDTTHDRAFLEEPTTSANNESVNDDDGVNNSRRSWRQKVSASLAKSVDLRMDGTDDDVDDDDDGYVLPDVVKEELERVFSAWSTIRMMECYSQLARGKPKQVTVADDFRTLRLSKTHQRIRIYNGYKVDWKTYDEERMQYVAWSVVCSRCNDELPASTTSVRCENCEGAPPDAKRGKDCQMDCLRIVVPLKVDPPGDDDDVVVRVFVSLKLEDVDGYSDAPCFGKHRLQRVKYLHDDEKAERRKGSNSSSGPDDVHGDGANDDAEEVREQRRQRREQLRQWTDDVRRFVKEKIGEQRVLLLGATVQRKKVTDSKSQFFLFANEFLFCR